MKIGSIVICKNGFVPSEGADMDILPASKDIFYTARAFVSSNNQYNEKGIGIYLEEIINGNSPSGVEWAYDLNFFKEVKVLDIKEILTFNDKIDL